MEKEEEQEQKKHSTLDYVADSEAVVASEKPKYAFLALVVMFAVIVFGLIWAGMTEVEEVTRAEGKVIVSTELQVIQHLEGGIVKKIYVKEGETVKKGQHLVELDDTRFAAEYKEGLAKLNVLEAEMVRLSAEANGEDHLVFSDEFRANNPKLVEHTINLFNSNIKALDNELVSLNKGRKLMQDEINIIKPLAENGVMSDVDVIRLERQLNTLETQILEKKENARQAARDSLNKILAEYSMLKERIKGSRDRVIRAEINSPVDGVINQIYVSTIGEVVQPGEKVVDIVPSGEQLTIQAYIRPTDIGFLHPGQKATIKVSAYDYSIYGGLDGEIVSLSPDAITDDSGHSYYEAKVRADKTTIRGKGGKLMPIIPGMTVTVSILTGERTILDYLLKPFYKAKYTALRER